MQQRRTRLPRYDGNSLPLSRDRVDLQIVPGAVMRPDQVGQAVLYCLTVQRPAGRKRYVVPQGDAPGQRVRLLPVCGEPRLDLHGIGIAEQRFPHAVADAGPAGIGVMRVDIRLLILRIKGGVAEHKNIPGRFLRTGLHPRAASRQKAECKAGCRQHPYTYFDLSHKRSLLTVSNLKLYLPPLFCGSSQSRAASPSRLKNATAAKMAMPGPITTQG